MLGTRQATSRQATSGRVSDSLWHNLISGCSYQMVDPVLWFLFVSAPLLPRSSLIRMLKLTPTAPHPYMTPHPYDTSPHGTSPPRHLSPQHLTPHSTSPHGTSSPHSTSHTHGTLQTCHIHVHKPHTCTHLVAMVTTLL